MAKRKKRTTKKGAKCKVKTYKSKERASAAASMARSLLPKKKKVSVEGKKVYIC